MIFKAPQMGVGSRLKYTFFDPETGERIPAVNVETGEEVWGGQWYSNMITDRGLDGLAASDVMGGNVNTDSPYLDRLSITGNLPEIKESSGVVTASQSGTTVTASAAFFAGADVGRAIVWADGSNARVVTYISPTVVEVDKDQIVAAQTFERWHVDLPELPEPEQTSTTSPDSRERTFLLESEHFQVSHKMSKIVTLDQNRNISGIGLGNITNNAFVVECIRDGSGNPITVSMLSGKAVRVDHEMIFRFPRASKFVELVIQEYDAGNQYIGETVVDADMWAFVSADNMSAHQSLWLGSAPTLMPYGIESIAAMRCGLLSAALYTPGDNLINPRGAQMLETGNPPSNAGNVVHMGVYVAGQRRRTKEQTLGAARQNGAAHGFVLTNTLSSAGFSAGMIVQFRNGATFTKADTHTLRVGYEVSWDRDYTV